MAEKNIKEQCENRIPVDTQCLSVRARRYKICYCPFLANDRNQTDGG